MHGMHDAAKIRLHVTPITALLHAMPNAVAMAISKQDLACCSSKTALRFDIYVGPAQRPTKPQKPAAGVPLGVLKLLIRNIELKSSDTCFVLLKAGPQWGRSATLQSSDKRLDFNWEVCCARSPALVASSLPVPNMTSSAFPLAGTWNTTAAGCCASLHIEGL